VKHLNSEETSSSISLVVTLFYDAMRSLYVLQDNS
jgi:hypothetical protein